MYTPHQIKALFAIFKSGSIENIELAIQLSNDSKADFCLPHFEELFDYLVAIKAIHSTSDNSIAEKIHTILNQESLQLKIENTDFAIIPASIYLFKNLKKLAIIAEVEVHVPNTISYFENLEELEICLLSQDKIPSSIFELKSLKKLDLSLNLFEELPREIWKLRELVELNLSNCLHLYTIPNELFGLPKLKTVLLIHTLVDEISPSIAYSPIEKYLIEFDSEGKKLMTSQVGMKMLKNMNKNTKWGLAFEDLMQSKKLYAQKISNVPDKIKSQGLNAIKDYFKGKTI